MNKDELLKIYSACLPYGLEFEAFGRRGKINEIQLKPDFVLGLDIDSHVRHFYPDSGLPIFYPLEYLTKPIEHEGKMIIPLYELQREDKAFTTDFIETFGYEELKVSVYEKLLEWHFNVFQLPEDQFINKATLTQKQ